MTLWASSEFHIRCCPSSHSRSLLPAAEPQRLDHVALVRLVADCFMVGLLGHSMDDRHGPWFVSQNWANNKKKPMIRQSQAMTSSGSIFPFHQLRSPALSEQGMRESTSLLAMAQA